MVGMNRTEVLAAMDKLDKDTYAALLNQVTKPLHGTSTPNIQTVAAVLDAYITKVVRPFMAELIELNNAKISEDIKTLLSRDEAR